MKITLSPTRSDASLTLHRKGDVLTGNGQRLDLSRLKDGAVLELHKAGVDWLASDVTRTGGVLHLTVLFPYGPIDETNPASRAVTHPAPVTVTSDGPVALPGCSALA